MNLKTAISNNALEVLAYFGFEPRALPELELIVDIDALAKQIRNPTKVAVCNILDGDGKVVISEGKPAKIGVEVESEKQIPKSMRFLKWF